MYDIDSHIAELYDQSETYDDDVRLIRRLIGDRTALRILEPFCGTGRILIPLAQDGHELVGLDAAQGMLNRAQTKINTLTPAISARITLTFADVVPNAWPQGFDLVILGGNCFYELATPPEQAGCIASAAAALKPGGFVYVDNNHMEGPLAASWQQAGSRPGFPSGICTDGTRVESTTETIWYDIGARLARFRRSTRVTRPDGRQFEQTYEQQKHPVSCGEVQGWLRQFGFTIEALFGDRAGKPYVADSERAIFWARKGGS